MATKKITEVDVVNSLSDSDAIFVNSSNSLKQISKSNLVIKGADGGYYAPSVDDEGNLTWTASPTRNRTTCSTATAWNSSSASLSRWPRRCS